MKRRRMIVVGLAVLALVGALTTTTRLVWVAFRTPPPRLEDADRVEYGMSRAEVVAVLGRPPDRERDSRARGDLIVGMPDGTRASPEAGELLRVLEWDAEGEIIFVQLYADRVFLVGATSAHDPGLWRQFVHWLRTL